MLQGKIHSDGHLIQESIESAQLRMLYAQAPMVFLMGVLLDSFIFAVFGQVVDWVPIAIWWFCINLTMALYLFAWRQFKKKRFCANNQFWARLASVFYFVLGSVWTGGLLWIILHVSAEYHIFLLTVYIALAAASMVLSTWRMAYLLFQTSLMLPIILWLLMQNQSVYFVMSIFMIMFMLSMGVFANQVHRMLRKTFRLNLENKALAASLKSSNEKLKVLNDELTTLSVTDSLTQVANRRYFEEQLKKEIQRSTRERIPLSLLMIDVDYFKRYNDIFGHLAGDEALVSIARCIRETIRRPADLVARYGGEEFSVLLTNTTAEGALQVAEQIRSGVENLKLPHPESSACAYVTVSVGVSSADPDVPLSREVLLFKADAALYVAKGSGRNAVRFEAYADMIQPDEDM